MRLLILFVFLFCNVSCMRPARVVEAEIDFSDMVVKSQHTSVEAFLKTCECKDGKYVSDSCIKAAEQSVIITSGRWQYHVDMMKFNSKISKTKPEPTSLPASSNICGVK